MKAQTYGPNPEGDEDKGWALLSVCWALVLVAFITTLIRVWIRVRITRNMGMDDIVMMITMVSILSDLWASYLIITEGNDNPRSWSHIRTGLQRPWTPYVLSHSQSTSTREDYRLGRLDASIHYPWNDQDLHLLVPASYR